MAEYNGICNSELMLLQNTRPGPIGKLTQSQWLAHSSEINKVGNPNPNSSRFRFRLENCLLWITTQQQRATVTPAVIGWHFKNALSSKQSEIKISVQSIQSKKSLRLSVNYLILKVLPQAEFSITKGKLDKLSNNFATIQFMINLILIFRKEGKQYTAQCFYYLKFTEKNEN